MYRLQVKVRTRPNEYEWHDVYPTGGKPYEYDTRKEAEDMARICYGSDPAIVRVVEV